MCLQCPETSIEKNERLQHGPNENKSLILSQSFFCKKKKVQYCQQESPLSDCIPGYKLPIMFQEEKKEKEKKNE